MNTLPTDLQMVGNDGHVVSRDELRRNVLRDWSIIVRTLSIEVRIEGIESAGNAATVYTRQRWDRLMLERDGKTVDRILTTQRHSERWRLTPSGWMPYEVTELGGDVYVNGRRLAGKSD